MSWEEFLDMLDMDSTTAEISYFEDLAELFENAEDIPAIHIEKLVSMSDGKEVGRLLEEYFEDVMKNLDDVDLYTLMTQILNVMTTNAFLESEEGLEKLADEIIKFREWYRDGSLVRSEDYVMSVCDAFCRIKEDKLIGRTGKYDFENALDYEVDTYTMTLSVDDVE